MSPDLVTVISWVVNDCRVFQKSQKSIAWPRVTLPKSSSFNKIVTLDLKEFGSKYILWIVENFTRFIQGKLIPNKKADTIISTLMDTCCMNLGIPTNSFFTDNGGKFTNVNLDEFTSKLGLTVKFGPALSLWSNGINERNHSSTTVYLSFSPDESQDILVKLASLNFLAFLKSLHCFVWSDQKCYVKYFIWYLEAFWWWRKRLMIYMNG